MITLITGMPGSGKSAAMLDLIQREAGKNRPVYADGIPDLKVTHVALEDPKRWPELVPDGSIVAIDEVQRVWRPTAPGAKVSPEIEAFETHRHRGLDFILVTQHPNLLHQNVRRLVGRHVHIRDNGFMGRYWYEWPEATDPATFKSAPIRVKYRLPKAVFGLYKSASLHVKPIRRIPPAFFMLGACVAVGGYFAWSLYSSMSQKLGVGKAAETAVAASAPAGKASGAPLPYSAPVAPAVPVPAPVVAMGCVSMKDRCTCLGSDGAPMVLDPYVCKLSAESFGGIVRVNLTPSAAPSGQPAAQPVRGYVSQGEGLVPGPKPVASAGGGFNAGDFRERPPLPHVLTAKTETR